MSRLDDILALPSVTHALVQGSSEWDQFRLQHRGASETAAALGLSKKVKRNDLLHAKHTGLPREFSDWLQRNVLDRGHEVEALARPHIEKLISDDLYPVTRSRGDLSASCDGLTMDDRCAFEHKQWNDDLAAMVGAGIVPDEHLPQCQQVLLVTGAKELIFVVSDGTPERLVWAMVTPDRQWWERIVAGWDQFDADLEAYEPIEIKERPKAEVSISLPALFIHAKGEITTSNMKEYGIALAERLATVRSIQLLTDQDFSNAKESAKLLREQIQQAKLAKEQMLAQTVTVGEAAKMIDAWCEDMRLTALKLEQDVEREDRIKKTAMIAEAKGAYEAHIEALKADTGGPWIVLQVPDWAGAIKGKRNFASMQDALDTALANGKIAADDSARRIRAAQTALAEESKGYEHLFPDRLAFISKSAEDVRSLARARITEHRAAEERRAAELAEQQRARIQREEQAKAEKAAREKIEADQRAAAAVPAATAAPAQPLAAAPIASPVVSSQAENVVRMLTPQESAARILAARLPLVAKTESTATIRLGEINERLAPVQISAAGLATLGFEPVGKERAAVLYRASDFQRICMKLMDHIESVAANQPLAA